MPHITPSSPKKKKNRGSRIPAASREINNRKAVTDKPFLLVSSEKSKGKVCNQVPSFNIADYPHWTGKGTFRVRGQDSMNKELDE
jgi:hypothetical protein